MSRSDLCLPLDCYEIPLLMPRLQPLSCCQSAMLKMQEEKTCFFSWRKKPSQTGFGGSLLYNQRFGHWKVCVLGWSLQQSPAQGRARLPSPPRVPLLLGDRHQPKCFSLQVYGAFLPAAAVRLLEFLKHCLTSAFLENHLALLGNEETNAEVISVLVYLRETKNISFFSSPPAPKKSE